jgi:hypothetical protein
MTLDPGGKVERPNELGAGQIRPFSMKLDLSTFLRSWLSGKDFRPKLPISTFFDQSPLSTVRVRLSTGHGDESGRACSGRNGGQ